MGKYIKAPHETLADEEIVGLYWQREESAIQQTDRKYGTFLYRLVYNVLHDRCDSEECRNDTYLGIWNAVPPAKPTVFPAFIAQIARRIAINRYKEKNCQKRVPSELTVSMEELTEALHGEVTTEESHTSEQIGALISNYVRSLTERQQYLFVGRYYMSETVEYLAQQTGVSASAVYKELGKLREGLREFLARNEVYV